MADLKDRQAYADHNVFTSKAAASLCRYLPAELLLPDEIEEWFPDVDERIRDYAMDEVIVDTNGYPIILDGKTVKKDTGNFSFSEFIDWAWQVLAEKHEHDVWVCLNNGSIVLASEARRRAKKKYKDGETFYVLTGSGHHHRWDLEK